MKDKGSFFAHTLISESKRVDAMAVNKRCCNNERVLVQKIADEI